FASLLQTLLLHYKLTLLKYPYDIFGSKNEGFEEHDKNNLHGHMTLICKESSTLFHFKQEKYNVTDVGVVRHLFHPYTDSADEDVLFLFPVFFALFSKL